MRVGLRLQGSSCQAVVLDGHSVVFVGAESRGSSLLDALENALLDLPRERRTEITDITADVSPVLAVQKLAPVTVIRISPRPPADALYVSGLPAQVEPIVTRTVYVRGGHDLRGRVLAPLDLESFLTDLPEVLAGDGRNVAITSVGALASRDHETRIADAILSRDSEMRISISSDFYSNAFRDREYTATLNSSLMETGEELAGILDRVGRRHFPSATMSFSKNDGGCAPLSRLALRPIHGLRPEPAMRILGAAALAEVLDGEVILCSDARVMVGQVRSGLPVTRSLVRQGYEASLASNVAVIEPYTANHPARPSIARLVVDHRTRKEGPLPFGLLATLSPAQDTALVGSAVAPLTAWIDRLETVQGRADLETVQHLAEEDAKSAVVHLGADPGHARIIESNAYALPYGNPGIMRIRVQAASGTPGVFSQDKIPLFSSSTREWGSTT